MSRRWSTSSRPARFDLAIIEAVSAAPMAGRVQGTTSMFSFGRGLGLWEGILAALAIPHLLVTPQVWKRAVLAGTSKDKPASIAFAQGLFPGVSPLPTPRCRVPHDGLADALCPAEHGRRLRAGTGPSLKALFLMFVEVKSRGPNRASRADTSPRMALPTPVLEELTDGIERGSYAGRGPDVVERAADGVRRAIGKLVRLLDDDDPAVVEKAYAALAPLGQAAIVGGLTGALVRAGSPRLRERTLAVLEHFDPEHDLIIVAALKRALPRERDPDVAARMRWLSFKIVARAMNEMCRPTHTSTGTTDAVASLVAPPHHPG